MRRGWVLLFCVSLLACSTSHSTVARTPSAAPAAAASEDTTFVEAVRLVDAKRYGEAVPLLRSGMGNDERVEDYYLYYLGIAEARSGDGRAASRFVELRTRYPQSIWAPAAALELGRLNRQQGKTEEAEAFLAVAAGAPDRDVAASAELERAQILIAAGRNAEAAQILADLRRDARGTSAVPQARTLLRSLRAQDPSLALHGSEWLAETRLLLEERDFVGAEKAARTADPYGDDVEAHILLAESLKGQGNTSAAVSVLGQVVERHPDDPAASRALYRMAQLLWNENEDVSAEAAFLQFLKRYPGSPQVPDALYALARIQQSSGRSEAAIATYQKLVLDYPSAKTTWEARWRIGWILYSQRRWNEAASAFGRLADAGGDPAEVASALYWQARSLERAGRIDAANAEYRRVIEQAPISYYAGRAEQRLGEERFEVASSITEAGVPLPAAPPTVSSFHLARYQALREMGSSRFARGEVAAMEREASDPAALQFLFYAYANADDFPSARRIARQVEVPAGAKERVLYPLAFWDQVSEASSKNQVDPLLVVSLIRQESLFDPEARSPADARGLMQLLPSTARQEAAELGWKDNPSERLGDPEVNVTLGVRHLRSLIDQYDGDVVKALAAYNGGTGAVNRWQTQFAELEGDEFVESITYRETRDYVKRVLGNRRAYVRLYSSGG